MDVDSCHPSLCQTSSWDHDPEDLLESINRSEVWFIHAMYTVPVELVAMSTPSFLPVDSAIISELQVSSDGSSSNSSVDSHREVPLYIAAYSLPSLE